ncbi:MAG: hypothetical protein CM15mP120_01360 [Pseudomonadota bacterium]|nr:MAG: hypothetical protein CM15mP120_01360 [Pseudomonadota bacterium]
MPFKLSCHVEFFKANYPRPGKPSPVETPDQPSFPCRYDVSWITGYALHSNGLNNTWDWIDKRCHAGDRTRGQNPFQQDAAELVTRTMRWWLLDRSQ